MQTVLPELDTQRARVGSLFSMKKVLITGVNGLVGTHLLKKCLNEGFQVIGVDLKKGKQLPSNGWEFIQDDLTKPFAIEYLFMNHKFDAVFNCFGVKVCR